MNKNEQKAWQKKVVSYAQQTAQTHGPEIAAQRVWRWFGAPAEAVNGKLIIWFGREKVEI